MCSPARDIARPESERHALAGRTWEQANNTWAEATHRWADTAPAEYDPDEHPALD